MTEAIHKYQSTEDFLNKHADDFASVLPVHMSKDRMMRIALSALRTTPDLAKCTIQSVAMSLMGCSVLGLEPNTPLGHAYLIPFKKNIAPRGQKPQYEKQCQLIVGYRGMIELFYRSGAVSSVKATPVFQDDTFEVEYGLNPQLRHVPSKKPGRVSDNKLTHVYVVVRLKDGSDPLWEVIDREEVDRHRARSKSAKSGPWVTDYVAMALKTAIRVIHRWVPYSVEKVATAVAYEESRERGSNTDALAMLGGEAAEITTRLIGEIEDEPEKSITPDVNPLEGRLERTQAAPQPTPEPAEPPAPTEMSEKKRALISAAKTYYGEPNAMREIRRLCRDRDTDFATVTDEQCQSMINAINLEADKAAMG